MLQELANWWILGFKNERDNPATGRKKSTVGVDAYTEGDLRDDNGEVIKIWTFFDYGNSSHCLTMTWTIHFGLDFSPGLQ
jgi:hypothetical protein